MSDRCQIPISVRQTHLQLSSYSWIEAIMGSLECPVHKVNVEDHANIGAACFLLHPAEESKITGFAATSCHDSTRPAGGAATFH